MIHDQPHPQSGKTVKLKPAKDMEPDGIVTDAEYRIEDYWDRVGGGSWMHAQGNPAALKYAIRSGVASLPLDDDVVYGKINGLGHIMHVSELGETV